MIEARLGEEKVIYSESEGNCSHDLVFDQIGSAISVWINGGDKVIYPAAVHKEVKIKVGKLVSFACDVNAVSPVRTLKFPDTYYVTDFTSFFSKCYPPENFEKELYIGNAKIMTAMFGFNSYNQIMQYQINLDLSGWDISNVDDLSYMFARQTRDPYKSSDDWTAEWRNDKKLVLDNWKFKEGVNSDFMFLQHGYYLLSLKNVDFENASKNTLNMSYGYYYPDRDPIYLHKEDLYIYGPVHNIHIDIDTKTYRLKESSFRNLCDGLVDDGQKHTFTIARENTAITKEMYSLATSKGWTVVVG